MKTIKAYANTSSRDDIVRQLKQQGYTVLGAGTRAIVLQHQREPDIAVKVGVYDGRNREDGWLLYVTSEDTNPHRPQVHEIVLHDRCYVARMEALERAEDDYKYHWQSITQPVNEFEDLIFDCQFNRPSHVRFDLHDENVMKRPDGTFVVSDPWCIDPC